MTIGNVAGAVAGRLAVRCTAVPLALSVPIAPGARGSVAFDVGIRVPRRPGRFGRRGRLALLSNAIPALAHLEGGRWRLDRYFGAGESWTYPAADWTVRLTRRRGRRSRRRACSAPTASAACSTGATSRSPPGGCARRPPRSTASA